MSQQIEILCKDCTTCTREAVLTKEPLITPNRPRRPWQKVGSDLFDFNTRKYIVVVDFYSRWIHCSQIPSSTAKTVVNYLSALNEKYGYFDEIMTDNGPCYAGDIFRDFCKSIGASHITSSPRYPQSNGQAESAVKIAKNILKKNNGDLKKGLLSYNSTPFRHGFSPSQLFLGRHIKTGMSQHPTNLTPKWPSQKVIQVREKQHQGLQKKQYDNRHRCRQLHPLRAGDHVFIREGKHNIPGVILRRAHTPRSYIVRTNNGTLRRNRRYLLKPREQPVFSEVDFHEQGDEQDDFYIDYNPVTLNRGGATHEHTDGNIANTPPTYRRCSQRENRGVPPARYGFD